MKKVAVLGPNGTFCELAFNKFNINNLYEPIFYNSIEETYKSINNDTDYAIIPLENILNGYIQQSLDLLIDTKCKIIEEIYIPVKFSLVTNSSNLKEIENIYVQFEAKKQCIKFLNQFKNINYIITESNTSINKLINKKDAAIIPFHINTKAKTRIDNIEDIENNKTRFIVLSKKNIDLNHNEILKSSIWIITKNFDKPGLLYNILGLFSNIDLISIISRPTKKEFGKYNFFIELIIKNNYKEYLYILNKLKNHSNIEINELGEYLYQNIN